MVFSGSNTDYKGRKAKKDVDRESERGRGKDPDLETEAGGRREREERANTVMTKVGKQSGIEETDAEDSGRKEQKETMTEEHRDRRTERGGEERS